MHRLKTLDYLRGLAILLVLCTHGFGQFWLRRIGWCGVDLFFVLSGFLIAGLVFREFRDTGRFRAGRFLLRRGFKIYPSFYIFIIATLFIYRYGFHETPALSRILSECFFLQSYVYGLWPHTWSLGIEEQFYLLFALALGWMSWRKKSPGASPFFAFSLAGILLCIATIRYVHCLHPADGGIFFATHLRGDPIVFGILLAWFHVFRPEFLKVILRNPMTAMLVVLSFLSVLVWMEPLTFEMNVFGLISIYLGFGSLLCLFVQYEESVSFKSKFNGLPLRLLGFIGRHSYPVYLWHFPVRKLFEGWTASPSWQNLGFFSISLLAGILSSYLIEQPFLKWRERWT